MKSSLRFILLIVFTVSLIYLNYYSLNKINQENITDSVVAVSSSKKTKDISNLPQKLEMTFEVVDFDKRSEKVINFGNPITYSEVKGVTTFRGNNYRNSASFGTVSIEKEELEILWSKSIGSLDNWSGVGWNGQPVIVNWDYNLQQKMNIKTEKKSKQDLKEVIYGTLDGKIYFLDLKDGSSTRSPINLGAPIKGSVSVDPRGYPLLYSGQGIDTVKGKKVDIGYRIFNLFNQEELFFLDGRDNFAPREWGAFDSNVLIHKETDTMLIAGENGIFYRIALNTDYNLDDSIVKVNPEVSRYGYKIPKREHQGVENSTVAYKNYVFFADNGGFLQALDINTLEPIWAIDVTDDTDSTIVVEEEEQGVALYTACEVDLQGSKGKGYIRKINALNGDLIWEKSYDAFYHSRVNGGVLATPIVGKKDIGNLVIYNIARVGGLSRGLLAALDKTTGQEIWSLELNNYSWSSPVDIYTPQGKSYIVLGNSAGFLYLIEGTTGKILYSLNLGSNIEGSPAIYEDILVIGTRGQKIFAVQIK